MRPTKKIHTHFRSRCLKNNQEAILLHIPFLITLYTFKIPSQMKPIKLFFLITIGFCIFSAFRNSNNQYQCMPCGSECDKVAKDKPGQCSVCNMDMVKSSSIVFKTISPDSFCDYLKTHPKTLILDVRSKDEFDGNTEPDFGSLKNAQNIPIQELDKRLEELRPYQNQPIIVYCSHSRRSPRASYMLTQNGFTQVINLSGGMSAIPESDCKKNPK
jgi:rhodanese-related sulfurtransferase/DNA-directed RNA polymerase subunit RPC12/RpoP